MVQVPVSFYSHQGDSWAFPTAFSTDSPPRLETRPHARPIVRRVRCADGLVRGLGGIGPHSGRSRTRIGRNWSAQRAVSRRGLDGIGPHSGPYEYAWAFLIAVSTDSPAGFETRPHAWPIGEQSPTDPALRSTRGGEGSTCNWQTTSGRSWHDDPPPSTRRPARHRPALGIDHGCRYTAIESNRRFRRDGDRRPRPPERTSIAHRDEP